MAQVRVSAERDIPAPAAAVYALLADYVRGHPNILPPAFSDFEVLAGGVGAGTRIRFVVTVAGRKQVMEGVVAEPEPGRVLSETDVHNGSVTSFTVDSAGTGSRLRIASTWEQSRGIAGLVERFLASRLLRKLYEQELDLIERWAIDRKATSA
jgi:hypothetical protein